MVSYMNYYATELAKKVNDQYVVLSEKHTKTDNYKQLSLIDKQIVKVQNVIDSITIVVGSVNFEMMFNLIQRTVRSVLPDDINLISVVCNCFEAKQLLLLLKCHYCIILMALKKENNSKKLEMNELMKNEIERAEQDSLNKPLNEVILLKFIPKFLLKFADIAKFEWCVSQNYDIFDSHTVFENNFHDDVEVVTEMTIFDESKIVMKYAMHDCLIIIGNQIDISFELCVDAFRIQKLYLVAPKTTDWFYVANLYSRSIPHSSIPYLEGVLIEDRVTGVKWDLKCTMSHIIPYDKIITIEHETCTVRHTLYSTQMMKHNPKDIEFLYYYILLDKYHSGDQIEKIGINEYVYLHNGYRPRALTIDDFLKKYVEYNKQNQLLAQKRKHMFVTKSQTSIQFFTRNPGEFNKHNHHDMLSAMSMD